MGVESFMDAPLSGKRKAKRARVLLAVKIKTAVGEVEGRLRDLSRKGALVECGTIPPVGSEVLFSRGTTIVPARVAWTGGNRVGLEFAYMIDENEVLVQLSRTSSDANQTRFRRPRLFGEDLSEQEKKLAHAWGMSVGIKLPGE
jgi:PilZ domain-containing protein